MMLQHTLHGVYLATTHLSMAAGWINKELKGSFPSAKRNNKHSNQAKYMRGMNTKVTHLKDQTESQIESPENGNTQSLDKFSESTK